MNPASRPEPLVAGLRDQGDLPDASALLANPPALRAQLDAEGILLLRGLLPPEEVLAVRAVVIGLMEEAEWLIAAHPRPRSRPEMPLEGDPRHVPIYRRLLHHATFAGLARHPQLLAAVAQALGGEVLPHRRIIGRMAPPHQPPTQPHQDWQHIRGSTATLTAWIPLGDCPRALGGLAVLPRSHRLDFRPHQPSTGAGGLGVPVAGLDLPWLAADYRAGDVLLFPALTIHAALPNRSADEVRLSADFRYQRPGEEIDPASMRHHFGLE